MITLTLLVPYDWIDGLPTSPRQILRLDLSRGECEVQEMVQGLI